jgi:hypothetical protein
MDTVVVTPEPEAEAVVAAEAATNEADVKVAEAVADAAVEIAQAEAAADIAEADAAKDVAIAAVEVNAENTAWHDEHRSRLTALEQQHQAMMDKLLAIQSSLNQPITKQEAEELTTAEEVIPEEVHAVEAENPVVETSRNRDRWM